MCLHSCASCVSQSHTLVFRHQQTAVKKINVDGMQMSPERAVDGEIRREGIKADDRGGLAWKLRYHEQEEKLAALHSDYERVRLAAEAALARRTRAEEDLKHLRKEIRHLMVKSNNDDELIAALKEERDARKAGCATLCISGCALAAVSSAPVFFCVACTSMVLGAFE